MLSRRAIRRRTADVVDRLEHGGRSARRRPAARRRTGSTVSTRMSHHSPIVPLLDRQRPEAAQAGDELGEPADARRRRRRRGRRRARCRRSPAGVVVPASPPRASNERSDRSHVPSVDVSAEPGPAMVDVESPPRAEPLGPSGVPVEVVDRDVQAAADRVEGGDGENVARPCNARRPCAGSRASAAATGFSVPSDRSLTITGIGSVPRPNTAAANGSKRSRSGQMTMTSSGRSDGSATNRWPRASRSTSSWRIVPWQAWTWMLVSDDGLTNGVGGRSTRRSARTWASNDAVRPGAAASTTASATTAAGSPRTSAAVSACLASPRAQQRMCCRPAILCRRAGCAQLAGSRSIGWRTQPGDR